MEDKQTTNPDEELDPKRLKFGMSQAERKKLEAEVKRKKKWKPEGH